MKSPTKQDPTELALPKSFRYGESHFDVPDSATDEELHEVCKTLRRMEGSLSWWVGDFLIHVSRRKEVFELKGSEAAKQMAESFGVAYESVRLAMWVCENVEQSSRIDCSTFTHHRVALGECDGVSEAIAWVKDAAKENWSVSAMRARIRDSKKLPDNTTNSAINRDYKPLMDSLMFSKKWQPKDIPLADRRRLLPKLQSFKSWITEVEEITPR